MSTFKMYDNEVELTFNPDSRNQRYVVKDGRTGKDGPVRGTTSILRDIVHKPDLLMWPMRESHKKLFGAKFDDNLKKHFYDAEQALLQPETEYTEEQLQEFLESGSKAHRDKSDKGMDVGTEVHEAIENFFESDGKALPTEFTTPEADKAFGAFYKWWTGLNENSNVGSFKFEQPVYSRKFDYAGTYDLLIQINNRYYLLDFKTTNRSRVAPQGIYAEHFLQLGAYSYAAKEESNGLLNIHDVGVVNISKKGKLGIVTARDLNLETTDCERAFAFALRLHDWLAPTKKLLKENDFESKFVELSRGSDA